MKVGLYTDKNLHRAIGQGWNLKALAEGKVSTLGGRHIFVDVKPEANIKAIKKALEDLEGLKMEDMSIRTTGNRTLEDTEKLKDLGFSNSFQDNPRLVLVMTSAESQEQAASATPKKAGSCAERTRPEGSRTMTVNPGDLENSPDQPAGRGLAGEALPVDGAPQPQVQAFSGKGHVLAAGSTGAATRLSGSAAASGRLGGGDDSDAESRRRKMLAAAQARQNAR